MRLIAVANISNGKNAIGFRLLDTDTKQIKDVPLSNVENVLKSGDVKIDNLTIKEGKISGSNGSIDRLPKIVNNQLIGKSPIIVLEQLGDQGYAVSDFKGSILKINTEDILKYAKINGISNGKIVEKEGTEFISSINGKYTLIQTDKSKSDTAKERIASNTKIDYSKFKAIGCHTLNIDGPKYIGKPRAFLVQYENDIVYIPNMKLSKLKQEFSEIFGLFQGWIKYTIQDLAIQKGKSIEDIYEDYTHKLMPIFTPSEVDKNKKIFNIYGYITGRGLKGYVTEFVPSTTNDNSYTNEALYMDDTFITSSMRQPDNYKYVLYEKNSDTILVDTQGNTSETINGLDRILKITDSYIVGVNEKTEQREDKYYYKIIHRKDKQIVYKDVSSHYGNASDYCGMFRLIGDRYFINQSYNNGAVDLKTGDKLEYKFGNCCSQFICNVTDTKFTDAKGQHNIKELPDLKWTGYSTIDFIQKFYGFIPSEYRIGEMSLAGSGGFYTSNTKILVVKKLDTGIFYKKGNKLENILTGDIIETDDTLISWMKKTSKAGIIDKKPKDIKNISIWELLRSNKNVYGLEIVNRTLKFNGKALSTNFLKEKVIFSLTNITDIVLSVQDIKNWKGKTEIRCRINGQKITFETDLEYETFEIASMG